MKYISSQEVLFIHSSVIEETGGLHGVRDLDLLESALANMQQTFGWHDLYPHWQQKAAVLLGGLIKNHPFVDGNKRTAVAAMAIYLELNGYVLEADQQELVDMAIKTAVKADTPSLAAWIKSHAKKK